MYRSSWKTGCEGYVIRIPALISMLKVAHACAAMPFNSGVKLPRWLGATHFFYVAAVPLWLKPSTIMIGLALINRSSTFLKYFLKILYSARTSHITFYFLILSSLIIKSLHLTFASLQYSTIKIRKSCKRDIACYFDREVWKWRQSSYHVVSNCSTWKSHIVLRALGIKSTIFQNLCNEHIKQCLFLPKSFDDCLWCDLFDSFFA